jgi:ADP-ribose pyrophosphatase YjhB (NUDIX family)
MKLGVIIGRFQTANLTEAHKKIIDTVVSISDEVLICIGESPVRNTFREPLPYSARKHMIEAYSAKQYIEYLFDPKHLVIPRIVPIPDVGNLEVWCKNLDHVIIDYVKNISKNDQPLDVTIYGGTDSVVDYYKGDFKTERIEILDNDIHATNVREEIYTKLPVMNADFRTGMIYASQWRFNSGFATADAACIKDNQILLGKKRNRDKFQIPGGFFDPNIDNTLEDTAIRELSEECGVFGINPIYIGSFKISHDYRYLKERDKIITTVYMVDWVFGEAHAGDDIIEVKWFDLDMLSENMEDYVVVDHHLSINTLIKKLKK